MLTVNRTRCPRAAFGEGRAGSSWQPPQLARLDGGGAAVAAEDEFFEVTPGTDATLVQCDYSPQGGLDGGGGFDGGLDGGGFGGDFVNRRLDGGSMDAGGSLGGDSLDEERLAAVDGGDMFEAVDGGDMFERRLLSADEAAGFGDADFDLDFGGGGGFDGANEPFGGGGEGGAAGWGADAEDIQPPSPQQNLWIRPLISGGGGGHGAAGGAAGEAAGEAAGGAAGGERGGEGGGAAGAEGSAHANERLNERLNVLVLMLDATSRSHLGRMVPRLFDALNELQRGGGLRLYDFRGYSIVGYNSMPNMAPFLVGSDAADLAAALSSAAKEAPTIWADFKRHGARTFLLEEIHDGCADLAQGGTSSASKYFHGRASAANAPDHAPWQIFCQPELRPCCDDPASILRPGRRQCIGGVDLHAHLLDYTRRFWEGHPPQQRLMGLVNLMTAHEHFMTRLGILDSDLPPFLQGLAHRLRSDTALLIISDHGTHGVWYNDFAIGQAEHRQPAFLLSLPERFAAANPAGDGALRRNQARRLTSFDVHATLQHLAAWPTMPRPSLEATSLFVDLSPNRTCEQARVPAKFCIEV